MSVDECATRATEAALADEFRAAIDDARARVALLLIPACPTETFLVALRDEVARAISDPTAVPYPALANADAYWEATVKPQARSHKNSLEAIIAWLEERIIATMEVAEADLKMMVDTAAANPVMEPGATRTQLGEDIEARCFVLHHQMAEVLGMLPSTETVARSRLHAEDVVRAQATVDVNSLKTAYLQEAGGDLQHQKFAEAQWSETFADRVAHREAMLAATAPWRHLELALVGYERVISEAERMIEEAVVRLQAPLRDMPGYLLQRFDETLATAG